MNVKLAQKQWLNLKKIRLFVSKNTFMQFLLSNFTIWHVLIFSPNFAYKMNITSLGEKFSFSNRCVIEKRKTFYSGSMYLLEIIKTRL